MLRKPVGKFTESKQFFLRREEQIAICFRGFGETVASNIIKSKSN